MVWRKREACTSIPIVESASGPVCRTKPGPASPGALGHIGHQWIAQRQQLLQAKLLGHGVHALGRAALRFFWPVYCARISSFFMLCSQPTSSVTVTL